MVIRLLNGKGSCTCTNPRPTMPSIFIVACTPIVFNHDVTIILTSSEQTVSNVMIVDKSILQKYNLDQTTHIVDLIHLPHRHDNPFGGSNN